MALRKDSSILNGLVKIRVTVVKSVKNPTVPKYQWSSVFWNKRLKFPFKNNKYSNYIFYVRRVEGGNAILFG